MFSNYIELQKGNLNKIFSVLFLLILFIYILYLKNFLVMLYVEKGSLKRRSKMFLHLGRGHMLETKRIVMIGNIESSLDSEITEEFFDTSREEGFIIDYSEGEPRSFILTEEKIYYSIISAKTLRKRLRRKIG